MKDDLNILEELVKRAKKAGANSADAVILTSEEFTTNCREGKVEDLQRSENKSLGLRVFVKSKTAIVSSSDISKNSLKSLPEKAVAMAKLAPEDAHTKLADKNLVPEEILDLDIFDEKEPEEAALKKLAENCEAAALSQDGITNTEGASISYSRDEVSLYNSNKFAGGYASTSFGLSASVIAGEGENMQRDYEYSIASHLRDLDAAEKIGEVAAARTLARMNPKKIESQTLDVVFDKRVAKGILSGFASAVNGASIARGTSFLKEKMDARIFAEDINIYDDPHISRALGSKPFDDEAVKNSKLQLVENGVLKTWLLDTRSASKLGLETNARASRGLSSHPSPSSTNLYFEAGKLRMRDLVKSVKNGFYVTEVFGMGVNLVNGDYSQGASGFKIENGEITYAVSEVTIAGNLLNMYKSMRLADDLEFKYATNSPTMLIKGMTLAGS